MKKSELLRILRANRCYFVREGTNHEVWHSDITGCDFPVWRHLGKDIPPGTLRKILKEAGIR